MGKTLFELASLIIGVAIVTLILNPKSKTVEVINSGGSVFNSILKTITLQA